MSSGLTITSSCFAPPPQASPCFRCAPRMPGPGSALAPRGSSKTLADSTRMIAISNVLSPSHFADACLPSRSPSTCGPWRLPIGLIYALPASVVTSVAPVLVSAELATSINRVGFQFVRAPTPCLNHLRRREQLLHQSLLVRLEQRRACRFAGDPSVEGGEAVGEELHEAENRARVAAAGVVIVFDDLLDSARGLMPRVLSSIWTAGMPLMSRMTSCGGGCCRC